MDNEIKFGNSTLIVSAQKTAQLYGRGINLWCQCKGCSYFMDYSREFYPINTLEFLEKLGVMVSDPADLLIRYKRPNIENPYIRYVGYYIVAGEIKNSKRTATRELDKRSYLYFEYTDEFGFTAMKSVFSIFMKYEKEKYEE